MNRIIFLVAILALFSISCSKSAGGEPDVAPTNLTLKADVSADSSGAVTFTATATGATAYTFNYGDNTSEVTATGIVIHRYVTSGNYTVTVTARSKTNKVTSTSTLINVKVVQALVWFDEFDTPGAPNSAKWGYDLGAGGWGNNEVQNYTNRPDNVVVTSDGTLKITLKKESYQGSSYTSARLLTQGKFSFKYGKIEVKAKLPAGGGTWPAIWMLGDNISTVGWPACGEIDIMEHVGNQLNKIFSTMHYGPSVAGHIQSGGVLQIADATTQFHVYACEWSPALIKFTVDGSPIFTFANNATLPFNQNFFIILNVAMGGGFGGAIDPNFTSAAMEIDYVRVYN